MKSRRVVLVSLLIMIMTTTVFASSYNIKVKGEPLNTSVKVIGGRSMIGLRDIGEALDLTVNYDKESRKVSLDKTYQNKGNLLVLDLSTGLANSMVWGDGDLYRYEKNNLRLEVSPRLIEGRIYVPLRFVCDIFASPISISGENIIIGDIFSSGLKTSRLDESQKKFNSSPAMVSYDKYMRDLDKVIYFLEDVEYYIDELVNYPHYYLGTEGYYMSVDVMDYYSFLTGVNMETDEGHKIKKTNESLLLNLGNQFSDLGSYKVPNKTRINNLLSLNDQLVRNADVFIKKVETVENKANR